MTLRGDIIQAIKTRLEKLTAANGYATDVKKVYGDDIPMGIELNSYQMPALFVVDGPENIDFQQSCYLGSWEIRFQLWHNRVSDRIMQEFIRDVFKVIFADSPTAQVWDKFRGLHPSIVEVKPLSITPDLNMIEANRFAELSYLVTYRTKLYNL